MTVKIFELDPDREQFTGVCPYCGDAMQCIDSGYDYELDRPYDRYICLNCADKAGCPDADIHVDADTEEVL